MGKITDLIVIQMNTDNLNTESKLQEGAGVKAGCSQNAVSKHINGKLTERESCGRQRFTAGVITALRGLTGKVNSRTWERLTKSRLRLVTVHQEAPHMDIFRIQERATPFLVSSHSIKTHLYQ